MNCRACHLVDEQGGETGGGVRTYGDFALRSPIPDRGDGHMATLRNAPPLVNASLPRSKSRSFLHFDGEFVSSRDLVFGTLTGRNYGWKPDELDAAIRHIARVIREDDGSGSLAQEFGSAYTRVLRGSSDVAAEFRLPKRFRVNVRRASDRAVVKAVSKLIAACVDQLRFARDGAGVYTGSPFDLFLAKNGLPRARPARVGARLHRSAARRGEGARGATVRDDCGRRVRLPRSSVRVRRGGAAQAAHLPDPPRGRRSGGDRGRGELRRLSHAAGLHRLQIPQHRRFAGGVRRAPRWRCVRSSRDPGPEDARGGARDLPASLGAPPGRRWTVRGDERGVLPRAYRPGSLERVREPRPAQAAARAAQGAAPALPARAQDRGPAGPLRRELQDLDPARSRTVRPLPTQRAVRLARRRAAVLPRRVRSGARELRNGDPEIARIRIDANDAADVAAFLRALDEDYD